MTRSQAMLVVCLLAISASAKGQPSQAQELELSAVLESTERHHPLVLAAMNSEEVARAELMAARGGFDPQLDVSAKLRIGGYYELRRVDVQITQPTPLWGTEVYVGYRLGLGVEQDRYPTYYQDATRDGGEVRAGVRVPLWRNGILDPVRATRARAEVGVRAASLGRQQTSIELRQRAMDAYFGWVVAGRRVQVAQSLLELAVTRQAWVDARVSAGAIAEVEGLEAERSVLRRRADTVSSGRAVERNSLVLSLFYRDPNGSPFVVDPSSTPSDLPLPPPLATGADDEASIACNPRVAQKRAQLEQARIARDLARAQRAPRLDATLEVSRDFGGGSETLAGTVLEGGVVLSMPLGMRTPRGRLDAADAQVDALEQEMRLLEDQLRMSRQDALSQERNAREQYELATALLNNTERLAEAERTRFEAGSTSLFVVNLREQALGEAALAQVDAARELWNVQALWQAITSCGVE